MTIIVFGLMALLGALFLFVVAVALALSSWGALLMVVGVLWFAWWLAGKDWGVARALSETSSAADVRRQRARKIASARPARGRKPSPAKRNGPDDSRSEEDAP